MNSLEIIETAIHQDIENKCDGPDGREGSDFGVSLPMIPISSSTRRCFGEAIIDGREYTRSWVTMAAFNDFRGLSFVVLRERRYDDQFEQFLRLHQSLPM